MKYIKVISAALLLFFNVHLAVGQSAFDVVVVGGTPGGIMAAISASAHH